MRWIEVCINTPREEGMLGAERKAEELLGQIEGSVSLRQFRNPANPLAHYETTGPEIYSQLDGQIDYFVAGAGSGGTFSRSRTPQSPVFSQTLTDQLSAAASITITTLRESATTLSQTRWTSRWWIRS